MNQQIEMTKEALQLISPKKAAQMNILPLRVEEGTLFVGAAEPFNKNFLDDIAFYAGLKVVAEALSPEIIRMYLLELQSTDSGQPDNHQQIKATPHTDFSVINYVEQIIREAIVSAASDIHFEVFEEFFRIRYRIDGHLAEIAQITPQKSAQVISRIKILANLDISERRRPQDGRIKFQHGNYFIDIRVSCLPTSFGEKIVLRILDRNQLRLDFTALGFDETQQQILGKYLKYPHGMILATGPTGSGKTTTLYAALQHIHSIEKNILTIEDPVEYNLPGINQSAVKPDIGYTFAGALRTFLRQDPDVIMVGEIRDRETAEIAIRAALTGHLVLSTLHTNDSLSAIIRLIDMGIEPFLVSSSVRLILAQRLVRTLCTCKTFDPESNSYVKKGCPTCKFSGYKGRTALHEFFEITEEMSEMISKGATLSQLRNKAIETGFITLKEDGMKKISLGLTTPEEVLRETML